MYNVKNISEGRPDASPDTTATSGHPEGYHATLKSIWCLLDFLRS